MSRMAIRVVTVGVAILLGEARIGCCVCVAQESGAGDETVTLEKIVDAWRARQLRYRNVRVEWTETRTDFARMTLYTDPTDPQAEIWWPEEDTTFDSRYVLVLSERRSRCEIDGTMWVGPDQPPTLGPRTNVYIFDGTDVTRFHAEEGEGRYPNASLSRRVRNNELGTSPVKAVSWHCRPLDPDMGGEHEDRLALLSERGLTEGRPCPVVGVRAAADSFDYHWKLWVDPERDFNVVKAFIPKADGSVGGQFEISYSSDGVAAQVSTWDFVRFRNDKPVRNFLGNVERFDTTPTINATMFQVEFPPGTWVTDSRGERVENWIVKEDQTQRPILGTEILGGATYEELVATESGAARGRRPVPRTDWWERTLWLLAAVLLLGSAIWWWSTRRVSSRQHPGHR